jgi:hypothetical protein
MSGSAIIETTQQAMMQMLIQVLDPVLCRMAAAISGAGPPAMTDSPSPTRTGRRGR